MTLADDRFFPLCPLADLKSTDRRAFEIDGRSVLLLKLGQQLFAMRNRCTHLDFPLDTGRQIGFEIMCRQHGARFDIRTGRAAGGPAVRALEIYETRVVDGVVEIGLPERAAADPWPF